MRSRGNKKQSIRILFLGLALAMMLLPSASTLLWQEETSTENRKLAEAPVWIKDGAWNAAILSDAGAWFEDHFAFRGALVSVQSRMTETLLHTSSSNQVVLGKEGWLFYTGTLPDYTGQSLLSDREVYNIVHNVSLMQYYLTSKGSRLLICFAPNKNSVYDEYMPDRYVKGDSSNLERVTAALQEAGLPCVNLLGPLLLEKETTGEDLYFKTDSHWNNRGAQTAYEQMMNALGRTADAAAASFCQRTAAQETGDLAGMLYPMTAEKEEDTACGNWDYTWVEGDGDTMADKIVTTGTSGTGTLLMYRDSFAKALIPHLASAYSTSVFDRIVPYNLLVLENSPPADVIIERVERRIGSLQEQAALIRMPVIANPDVVWPADSSTPDAEAVEKYQNQTEVDALSTDQADARTLEAQRARINVERDGDFLRISGTADSSWFSDAANLYLQIENAQGQTYTYPTFYVNGDGFELFLENRVLGNEEAVLRLLQETNGKFVQTLEARWDGSVLN